MRSFLSLVLLLAGCGSTVPHPSATLDAGIPAAEDAGVPLPDAEDGGSLLPHADGGTHGGRADGGSADGGQPPSDDGAPRRIACTNGFGSALSTSFGRLDGYLVAIVPPGHRGCNGDQTHLHLQVESGGAV